LAFVLGLAIGAALGPGFAGQQAPASGTSQPRDSHPADVLRVLDGDTFEARVRVWPGMEVTTKVRLRGIDAPEMRARCPDERAKAEAAREALRTMLAEGDVAVSQVGFDKYGGRVLATAATRGTPDISAAMLAAGLARPYYGGRKEPWC
jgi:endonuclease YncB( thermonuclease family)